MSKLKVNTVYRVRHSRKGTFDMKVTSVNDTWIEGVIVEGKTNAMCAYNVKEEGDDITVRESFCSFEELGDANG